jgi:hypothetical protein
MLIFEVVILKPQVCLRLFGFSPEGDTFLPVCVSHRKTAKRFIQHIKPRGLQCRAIVPNGSTRRASGGLLRLFGFSPEGDTSLPMCIGQSRLLPQASN